MSIRRDKIQLDVEINGKKAGKTYRELVNDSRNLKRELLALTPGTDAFIKKSEELKGVNTKLADIRKQTRGVNNQSNKYLNILRKIGPAIGAAFVLEGARRFFGFLSEQVSEIDLLRNKFTTVFGEASEIVEASAERQAIALGLTNREYKKLAANAGDLLIPMKFQREEAAVMSTQLVNLSGALSAWTGGQKSAADVSDILTKALLGEREQLKTLGISIQEADVKQRLADKGMSKLTGTALQQAKALATLELVTEKSSDAQESFAKNGEGLIQTKARIAAQIRDISQRLATVFLPLFERALGVVEKVTAGVISFGIGLASLPKFIKDNRVQIGALIVALIALNAQSIAANANLLRQAALSKGATIATTAMTLAQRGLNVVLRANPIGLVITALALVASGFNLAYRKSETFRAGIDGIAALAKETFAIIKESVSTFLQGFDQIKEGNIRGALKSFGQIFVKANPIGIALTEGKRLKEAFNKGFEDSKTKSKIDSSIVDFQNAASELEKKGTEVGNTTGDAIIDGINKRLSAASSSGADSPETEPEKVSTEDPSKAAIDKIKAEGQAKLEQLQIQLLEEKITQKEHDTAVLEARRSNLQEQLDTLAEYGQLQTSAYRQTQIEQLKVVQEGSAAKVQAQLDELDKISEGELSELQKRFLSKVLTEQQLEEQSLQAKSEHYIRKLALLRKLGLDETEVFRKTQEEQLNIQKNIDQQKLENSERTEKLKQQLGESTRQVALEGLNFAIELLGKDEAARKKHASAIKAFQIGQIAVNLAGEISKIWQNSAAFGPLQVVIATAQTAAASIRAVSASNKVRRQKFYRGGIIPGQGGYTGDVGLYHDGQDYVADVDVHVGELVVPKWQLRHPKFSRAAKFLYNGMRGKPTTSFMAGGIVGGNVNTDPIGLANVPLASSSGSVDVSAIISTITDRLAPQGDSGQNLESLLSKMDKVLSAFETFPRTIKASVSIQDIDDASGELNQIRETAGF